VAARRHGGDRFYWPKYGLADIKVSATWEKEEKPNRGRPQKAVPTSAGKTPAPEGSRYTGDPRWRRKAASTGNPRNTDQGLCDSELEAPGIGFADVLTDFTAVGSFLEDFGDAALP
jgi:hypothetical protein